MAKSKLEIIQYALCRQNILPANATPSADDAAYCGVLLVGLIDMAKDHSGLNIDWDADSVPDSLFIIVGDFLADMIAPHYHVSEQRPRSYHLGRLRESVDTAQEPSEGVDDYGIEASASADARAAYY